MGGNATPPPVKWDTLPEPTRARPVPFCRHCFAVVPATSLRVFAEAVPCRWPASSAVTTWCRRPMLMRSCTRSSARACWPTIVPFSLILSMDGIGLTSDHDQGALAPRDRAFDQHQVLVRVSSDHGETRLRDTHIAHLAGEPGARVDPGRIRGSADGTGGAMEVSAVIAGTAGKPVTLHNALKALALADTGHLDLVAGGEGLHGNGVADGQIVLTPHLDEVALGSHTGLLEMSEQRLVQPLGLDIAERDLGRTVAVIIDRLLLGDQ